MLKYILLVSISACVGFTFSCITEIFTENPHAHFTSGYLCGLIVGGFIVLAVTVSMDETEGKTKDRETKAE
jgi:hypothetical protein